MTNYDDQGTPIRDGIKQVNSQKSLKGYTYDDQGNKIPQGTTQINSSGTTKAARTAIKSQQQKGSSNPRQQSGNKLAQVRQKQEEVQETARSMPSASRFSGRPHTGDVYDEEWTRPEDMTNPAPELEEDEEIEERLAQGIYRIGHDEDYLEAHGLQQIGEYEYGGEELNAPQDFLHEQNALESTGDDALDWFNEWQYQVTNPDARQATTEKRYDSYQATLEAFRQYYNEHPEIREITKQQTGIDCETYDDWNKLINGHMGSYKEGFDNRNYTDMKNYKDYAAGDDDWDEQDYTDVYRWVDDDYTDFDRDNSYGKDSADYLDIIQALNDADYGYTNDYDTNYYIQLQDKLNSAANGALIVNQGDREKASEELEERFGFTLDEIENLTPEDIAQMAKEAEDEYLASYVETGSGNSGYYNANANYGVDLLADATDQPGIANIDYDAIPEGNYVPLDLYIDSAYRGSMEITNASDQFMNWRSDAADEGATFHYIYTTDDGEEIQYDPDEIESLTSEDFTLLELDDGTLVDMNAVQDAINGDCEVTDDGSIILNDGTVLDYNQQENFDNLNQAIFEFGDQDLGFERLHWDDGRGNYISLGDDWEMVYEGAQQDPDTMGIANFFATDTSATANLFSNLKEDICGENGRSLENIWDDVCGAVETFVPWFCDLALGSAPLTALMCIPVVGPILGWCSMIPNTIMRLHGTDPDSIDRKTMSVSTEEYTAEMFFWDTLSQASDIALERLAGVAAKSGGKFNTWMKNESAKRTGIAKIGWTTLVEGGGEALEEMPSGIADQIAQAAKTGDISTAFATPMKDEFGNVMVDEDGNIIYDTSGASRVANVIVTLLSSGTGGFMLGAPMAAAGSGISSTYEKAVNGANNIDRVNPPRIDPGSYYYDGSKIQDLIQRIELQNKINELNDLNSSPDSYYDGSNVQNLIRRTELQNEINELNKM